jgi:enoyl-CoA hydratase
VVGEDGLMTEDLRTLRYEVGGGVARIFLREPKITLDLPGELERCVEAADLDPRVHVIALAGDGAGFCGGYDLRGLAEGMADARDGRGAHDGSPMDAAVIAANHDPQATWDPLVDFQFMSRCTRAWTSLTRADKPTVCKVHGYAIAGGSDLALSADLLVIAADAKLAYPPSRVWGVPTTSAWVTKLPPQRAKRLLLTGDGLTGAEAEAWGLAAEAPSPADLDARFEALLERLARVPVNQLVALKLFCEAPHRGPRWAAETVGTLLDGAARHTPEGFAFQQRAAEAGYRQAVGERDRPFGDEGRAVFRG